MAQPDNEESPRVLRAVLFLRRITTLLGGLLIFLIVASFPLIAGDQWVMGSTHNVYSGCQMKRMESKIEAAAAEIFIDYCMEADGYRRDGAKCPTDGLRLPTCFHPRWQFWK